MFQQWIIDRKTLSTRISIPDSHINQQVSASLEKLNVHLPAILETWTFRKSIFLDIFFAIYKETIQISLLLLLSLPLLILIPDWRNACMLLTMYHQKTLYNKYCLHEAMYITCVITK